MDAATFTPDTEALASQLALAYEDLPLDDLHPGMAGKYRVVGAELVSRNVERSAPHIAKVLAEEIEGEDLQHIAPWVFVRHLDVADTVLAEFA